MDFSSSPPDTEDAVIDAYAYGLLDPRIGAAGENQSLLGAATLGIEVTVPELARRCGLGNIDPQHGGGIGVGTAGAAAIEACLTLTPPPAGATLVTVRPDLDAFGAMALLALRRAGRAPVVVAHDPGSPDAEPPAPRRIVVAQYAPGHVELRSVRDALATLEPGWGGSSTILGSPQGRPCGLALAKVVEVVARHLRPAGEEPRGEAAESPAP